MAAGVALPRRGSLQAKLLQELDFRERNLRLQEVRTLFMFLEELVFITSHILPYSPQQLQSYQEQTLKRFRRVVDAYEPELFQDRYLPEYARAEQEISRREREQELQALAEEKRRRDFVEGLGVEE